MTSLTAVTGRTPASHESTWAQQCQSKSFHFCWVKSHTGCNHPVDFDITKKNNRLNRVCIVIWLEPPQWLSLTARSGAAGENSTFPMGKMHLFNDWTYTCQIPPWDINKIPCFGTTNSHCSLCMDDHFDFRDAPHESEGSTTKSYQSNSWPNCTPTVHRLWRPQMTGDNYISVKKTWKNSWWKVQIWTVQILI